MASTAPTQRGWLDWLRRNLPAGRALPDDVWRDRHRVVVGLLVLHVLALAVYSLFMGYGPPHSAVDVAPLVFAAVLASMATFNRAARTVVASLGLVASSAILVHLSHGRIETHFHFFVALAIIAFYQEWLPYLTAIVFVLFEHGIVGVWRPGSVYDHESAIAHPWLWAGIHAGFVAAAALAYIVQWRFSEAARQQELAAIAETRRAQSRYQTLVEQMPAITYILNHRADDDHWSMEYVSPQLETLVGVAPAEVLADIHAWTDLIHPEDHDRIAREYRRALDAHTPLQLDYRYCVADERVIWVRDRAVLLSAQPGESRFQGVITDVTETKLLEEQLVHHAFHDTLTELPNRALFLDRLGHALEQSTRRGATIAVLFLDLDNFKHVNDSLGHGSGDELLRGAAERIADCLRAGDTLARLGGDEFTVLLEDLHDEVDALTIADRILSAFEAPFVVTGHEFVMSVSIGLALAARGSVEAGELLRRADVAMYEVKDSGKSGYRTYDPNARRRAISRLELEADLRQCIERGELRVYFQPEASAITGEYVGVEALVRWEHPRYGQIPPLDFIPIAEETGLIIPIGEWVLSEACRQAVEWGVALPEHAGLMMSVNLSARQFQQPDLVARVAAILEQTGFPAHQLALELTESAIMQDANATVRALNALKAIGVQIAIDDFGTGFSSLAYLKQFAVDLLKIDRSFIANLTEQPEDAVLIAGIISLAHDLGLRVVAEGVETAEQLKRLHELGCDLVQGYYFARPLPPAEAYALLSAAGAASVAAA